MAAARKVVREAEADAHASSLPPEKPQRARAGHGTGVRCDLCCRPIEADQIEYEIDLPPDARLQVITLHLQCYEQWILLSGPNAPPSPKPDEPVP